MSDVGGNAHHGAFRPLARVAGRRGGAFKFERASVICGDLGGFDGSQPFTLGGWVKPASDLPASVLGNLNVKNSFRGCEVRFQGGAVVVQLLHTFPSNMIYVRSIERLPVDRWLHVMVTYDGSSKASGVRLYVNGGKSACVVTKDGLDGTARSSAPFRVGSRAGGSWFQGAIDDVQVFKKELLAADVLDVVQQGLSKEPAEASAAREGRIARWLFDEKDGLQVLDATGNGNDGAIEIDDAMPGRVAGRSGKVLTLSGASTIG